MTIILQEVNAQNIDGLPKQRKQPILARGISLSRSDLINNASQPEASPRSVRPTDAWPQLSQGMQIPSPVIAQAVLTHHTPSAIRRRLRECWGHTVLKQQNNAHLLRAVV